MARNDDINRIADAVEEIFEQECTKRLPRDATEEEYRKQEIYRLISKDLMENGRYQSRMFDKLVGSFDSIFDDVADHARINVRNDRDFADVVEYCVKLYIAYLVSNDAKLMREYSSEQQRYIRDSADLFADMVEGKQTRDTRRDERDYGRERTSRYANRSREDERRSMRSPIGRDREERPRDTRRDTRRDERDYRNSYRRDNYGSNKAMVSDFDFDDFPVKDARVGYMNPREERRVETPVRNSQVKPEPAPVQPSKNDGPDFTNARPFDEFYLRGEHWIWAEKSKYKLTLTAKDYAEAVKLPRFIDFRYQLRYHVKDVNGNVREEIIEVNDDNRYLSHELRNDTKPVVVPTRTSHPVDDIPWDDLTETTDTRRTSLTNIVGGISGDRLGTPVVASSSIKESIYLTRANTIERKGSYSGELANLEKFIIPTQIASSNPLDVQLINKVAETSNLHQAAAAMQAVRSAMSPAVFGELDQRFTKLVNGMVKHQFFATWNMDSFTEDWAEAVGLLKTNYDHQMVSDILRASTTFIPMATAMLDKADVVEMLEVNEAVADASVVFTDNVVVVTYDRTADEVGIGNEAISKGNGVVVTSVHDNALARELAVVFTGMDTLFGESLYRMFISGTDGKVNEVSKYRNGKDNFIIAKPMLA